MLALLGPTAVGASVRASTTTVKPDFSYYVGKTVTLYAGGAPGGTFYAEVQIIAQPMATYLKDTINIVDVPAAATVPEQNDVAASPPNGLTFGEAGIGTDISQQATNTALIDFPLSKVVPIGGIKAYDGALEVQPGIGITTLTQLLTAPNVSFIGQVSGVALLETNTLVHAYRSSAQVITGYANATTAHAGFLSKVGTAYWASLLQGETDYQSGKAVIVAQLTPPPTGISAYNYMKTVPTLVQYFAKHPPKTKTEKDAFTAMMDVASNPNSTNQLLFAPHGTPAKYAAALTAAFRSVMAQKAIVPNMLAQGLTPGFTAPAVVMAQIKKEIKEEPALAKCIPAVC